MKHEGKKGAKNSNEWMEEGKGGEKGEKLGVFWKRKKLLRWKGGKRE